MKETAIQWLLEELNNGRHLTDELINKAKRMEKQQIMDANTSGVNQGLYGYKNAEEYYNTTYKNNK
jgi:predicted alpha/beta-fold hydrolase